MPEDVAATFVQAHAMYPVEEAVFLEACRRGFPPYLAQGSDRTPSNSMPYAVTPALVLSSIAGDARREGLFHVLLDSLDRFAREGVQPHGALIGGSFARLGAGPPPRDLDVLMFYSASHPSGPGTVGPLLRELLRRGLDLRLCPIDADPLITVKLSAFFGYFYATGRTSDAAVAPWLVVFEPGG